MASNVYYSTAPMLACPAGTDGAAVTPSGISETFSAWFELEASTPEAWRLAAMVVLPGSFAVGNFYEVEIGVGALGMETAVAAQRGYSGNNAGASAESGSVLTLGVPADVIPSGSRVSVRLRQASTNTATWRLSIQYWALPMDETSVMPASSIGPVNVPAGSRVSASSSGTAWASGSWSEVTASTDANWTIQNVVCFGPIFIDWEMDIGVGAAGSEVVRWTVKSHAAWFASSNAWQGGPWNILLRPTLGPIAAGQRVAVRMRKSTSGVGSFSIGLTVLKEYLVGVPTALPMAWAPAASNFIPVVAAGSWQNYGSWVEFIASTSTPIALCNIASTRDNTGLTGIEVGVGPVGEESVVARMVAQYGVAFGGGRFNLPLPYARLIPSGSRVCIRTAVAATSINFTHWFALGYIAVASVPDFENWSDSLIETIVGGPSVSCFSGASAWSNGSWVTVDSGELATSRIITGYALYSISVPVEAEFDFGIGAAGSETVVTTERWEATDSASGCSMLWNLLAIPQRIEANVRLAIRARCSRSSSTTFNWAALLSEAPVPPSPPDPDPPDTEDVDIVWVRRSPTVMAGNLRVFHKELEVLFSPGVGRANPPGDDPQCVLRTSNDGGYTWSSMREAPIGPRGDYEARTRFRPLGSARRRVYEISGTARVCMIGARLDAEEGHH